MINSRENLDQLAILADQKTVEKEYWLKQLSGEPGRTCFPYDYNKTGTHSMKPEVLRLRWEGDLVNNLMEKSKGADVRLHMILTAGVVALLNKYTGSTDILVGTPIYKQEAQTRLINTILPLRLQLEPETSFLGLLKQVRQTIADGIKHYRYPMEILSKQLNIEAEPGEFPLFATAVLLENIHDNEYMSGIHTDISFLFQKEENALELKLLYNSLIYKQHTIKQLGNHLAYLLEEVMRASETPVSEINILSEQELNHILYDFNDTKTAYPADKTIPRLFKEQVEKTPEGTAVVGEDKCSREHLTYDCLDNRANIMASVLKQRGLGPEGMAGLVTEPSIGLISAILGILKTGSGYVPIDTHTPQNRLISMLDDCEASVLVTDSKQISSLSFTGVQGLSSPPVKPFVTSDRPSIRDLNNLPIPNRSLVDYEKYNKYIGLAAVKDSVCIQGTRGCPFKCAYCHKIWPKTHIVRSAQHIFDEVKKLYDLGVRRYSFIDDIFNLDEKNSRSFFEMILQHNLDIQMFFPNGLRGELLTEDYIDLMVEAGTINISLSLETASPRLQKLIKKNLKIEKLRENMHYLCKKYPQVILDVQTMHGFPTETEEEAIMTLDFIKSMKWLHFPYVHILKIYPNTEMEELAIANGISKEIIDRSARQGYHELAETLPFDKNFSLQYQSEFLNQYFLSRERLLHVLPHQMNVLTEDEIVQKYNAYLAVDIRSFQDLLDFTGISRQELGNVSFPAEDYMQVPELNSKFQEVFPTVKPDEDAIRILFLDLSTFFSQQVDVFYDMIEPPLGPMYVLTYLNDQLGSRVNGRISKSRIDFDSYEELKQLLQEFKPDVIGARALTYYKDFFHQTISIIRQWGYDIPIIAGGPYATSDYNTILKDKNINLVVKGEGEVTFCDIIEKMIANDGKLPQEAVLKEIPGIAFVPKADEENKTMGRDVVLLDYITPSSYKETLEESCCIDFSSGNLAYSMFTSGSTGRPKGTYTTHYNVTRVVKDTNYIQFSPHDRVLQLSNYAFDGSVFDIYGALLNGAALVLMEKEKVFSAQNLATLLKRENISVFFLTTALFNALVDLDIQCFSNVRKVLFGGERVSVEHVKKALSHLGPDRILHMYGPTETTVYATYYPVSHIPAQSHMIPIGKPLSNTTIYILDDRMKPVPIGVAGEIYIGGKGVARGYRNREDLTIEKFVSSPFDSGETLYRTGDLARWLEDGNIEFLDRIDRQVKLRGFRIELGEIEKYLLTHEAIHEALVVPLQSDSGDRYLCAYITTKIPLETGELKEFLSHDLPEFMLPSYFVFLEQMPLTANGKIDIKQLPQPGIDGETQFIAPRNNTEEMVAEIWKKVLGRESVGIHDNYFEVGGNSLNVIQLNSRLKEMFKTEISLATMFRYPSIHSFCEYLSKEIIGPGTAVTEEPESISPEAKEIETSPEEPMQSGTGNEIAVIGMSGRYPNASNLKEFWENLKNGIESISFFTTTELTEAGIEPDMFNASGYVKTNGGALQGIEYFDAAFFDYTAEEAEIMVPQMRIFHECVWEALENAGYPPGNQALSIGLYAGSSSSTLWEQLTAPGSGSKGSDYLAALLLSGRDFLCTRISYNLNLKGPSVLLNTACSTSLTAIDHAVQDLLRGRCEMALAGGVEISLTPSKGYWYQDGMINSPDGHCRAFDAKASGTIGGEGVGVVVLKKMQQALKDNDFIYAVIKGVSVNNDGRRKVGYTAPSVEGQADVIRAAYRAAAVEPQSITYVETHGTGTSLGDPIEIEALKLAFNCGNKKFCAIGSVKSNIGHLNSAAGVTGFIKTVLCLHHKLIPPSLNFETPNPKIDFENSPFYVNTTLKKWDRGQFPLRAGVSSFGIGGTNVHVVLEESPHRPDSVPSNQNKPETHSQEIEQTNRLLVLSAKTETALQQVTQNMAHYFQEHPDINFGDVAYTMHVGRKSFKFRRTLVSGNAADAANSLSLIDPVKNTPVQASEKNVPVVFLFPGLGAQYVEMGKELYRTQSLFREEMDRCFKILEDKSGYDLKNILYPPEGGNEANPNATDNYDINQIEISQLAVFVIQYALARLLISWGVKPQAVMGYSFGEYAAAGIAGIFTLEDALTLVLRRGTILKKTAPGAMMSVPLTEPELKSRLTQSDEHLSIGLVNGPSCIASGTPEAVEELRNRLKSEKYLCMKLETQYALHSSLMEPAMPEFLRHAKEVKFQIPRIPFVSGANGNWLTETQALEPNYWVRQMRETVRFSDGIQLLNSQLSPLFLEIGPGAELGALVKNQTPAPPVHRVINLMPPSKQKTPVPEDRYLLSKIGNLWQQGIELDGKKLYSNEKRGRIPLPTYPFEGKYFWKKVEHYSRNIGTKPVTTSESTEIASSSALIKNPDISQWFYLPTWTRSLPAKPLPESLMKVNRWLLFMDQGGLGERLAELLEHHHQEVIRVKSGEIFSCDDKGRYIINTGTSTDYERLITQLKQSGSLPHRIVHLLNCHESQPKEIDVDDYAAFFSLVYLARALGQISMEYTLPIEVISTHLQEVSGDEELYPEQSLLLGPCTVISQEYPFIRCRSIDIPAPPIEELHNWEKQQARQLLDECLAPNREPVVAIRNQYRWIRNFEQLELPETDNVIPPLRKNGVYLITGGMGTVGLILARYLAQEISARIILTGRSGFPEPEQWEQWLKEHDTNDPTAIKIKKLKEIGESGGEVVVMKADVADINQMENVIDRVHRLWGGINGVFYSATTDPASTFGTLRQISDEQCRNQFRAKVKGIRVLEKVIQGKEPDFCMLMSSTSAVLGGLGFVAYASANAYMDTVALLKHRDRNVRWISVNWEGWQSQESATTNQEKGFLKELTMTPAEGIQCVKRILAHPGINRVFHSPADLQTRLERWVEFKDQNEETPAVFQPRPTLLVPYEAPHTAIEQGLSEIWKTILGIEPIGINDNFLELGGDSLKAITVVSRIHKQLDVEIPLEIFFRDPTILGLATYIQDAEKSVFTSIPKAEKREYYFLSAAQKRLYILQQLEKRNTGYNVFQAAQLDGQLNREQLKTSLNRLVDRHESFRTCIDIIDNNAVQRINDHVPFEIMYYDATQRNAENTPASIDNIIKTFIQPFDLSNAPLLRVGLIQINENRHMLMLDIHHIISDGVSIGVFFREFMAVYSGEKLPPLKLQYRDYSQWQNSPAEQAGIRKQEEYWLTEFQGEIPILELPLDFKRPEIQGFSGSEMEFQLEPDASATLKQMAREEDVTMYMLVLTLFYVLLARTSGQEDIIIGTPIEGRPHPDLNPIMGFFVNTLALRNYPESGKSFRTFLKEVKQRVLKAFANQKYQFEDLVQKVALNRDLSRNPLFSVVFNFLNIDVPDVHIPGLVLSRYNQENQTAKFDLTLKGADTGKQLAFLFEYNTELFKPETIQRFIDHLKMIINGILQNKEVRLSDIPISSTEKQRKLISRLSDDLESEADSFGEGY